MDTKKDKIVFILGLVLIISIMLFLLLRNVMPQTDEKVADDKETSSLKKWSEYPKISAEELRKRIIENKRVFLLDVRSKDEFAAQHILDSFNKPLSEIDGESLEEIKNEQEIVIIAADSEKGTEAYELIKSFNKISADKIKILTGGFKAWRNKDQPVVNWGDPTSFVNHSKVTYISPEEIVEAMKYPNLIYIIDVRNSLKFSVGHLPGAVNIPLNMLEKKRKEIPSERKIIVYGEDKLESFSGGVILHDVEIFSAYVLKDGFQAWQEKKLLVEK